MNIRLLPLILVLSFFLISHNATACSPKEWSYEILEKESIAIIYGEVTEIKNDGRRATLKVIKYVGPGVAPQIVRLPSTASSQKTNDDPCPDFSMKFQKGKKYLVFLKEIGKTPALLYSDSTTSLEVQRNKVMVNMQEEKVDVDALVQKYAEFHLQEVKAPNQNAPSWGTQNDKKLIILSTLVILMGIGIICFFIKRRMHNPKL
ncbi:hypothetical protein Back11_13710 [Paenibacillus baekrokdamisoli]|uniref:Uncharacterized protein n=1 Tax=Paenibacillus baekrokdamisoli TaxID=1712516 RepID=A0A3G9INW1_9BACL|nr:hypothetical protein [Paenibacillus baekrokdamisoli]MBB3070677.1 hypothetical protein [Paenibacillus baekrokdamisoli]BBH20026.1 hypothetical protein Back11_13710 [Paenibacillus baekrokdamisoli]